MDLVFAPSQIETWPIARLRPYARNAKMHGDDQVAKIAASMAKFGWTVPCMVADDGELIAGHGRVLAATMLGWTEVPVIRLAHLDEAERRAYRIADNKLTELGEWDEALLRDEIAGLLAEDFDLSLLGISDEDLDALLRDPEALGGDGPVEGENDVPDLPVTPVSVPGDLWQLGAHRLICGDSTSANVVGRLLGDVRPLLMVASTAVAFAGFMAGRWVAGALAATLSVRGLATALVFLRGALIRTGIGALIVGAGELVYWFSRLVTGAGGFGAAMGLLRDVAVEVWDRIKMGASSAGARATAMFLDLKSDAASAMASAIESVVDFGNTAVNTFQGTFHAVQAVWNALPDVFARIGALAMNTLIEAMQSGLAGVTEAINTVLTLGGRRPEWAIAPPDLSDWMAVVPEAIDIGGRAAEGFARGFETNLLAVPDLGLEAIAQEALASANTWRQAAEDLARGATAPLASWQALMDAVTSAGHDGADALADAEGSARRLTDALEETEDQATRAGGAARQAGAEAAAGAEEAATGWRAVSATLADYARDAMDWGKGLGKTLVGAFRSAENAFRAFVKTGKLDFRSLISSILADLAMLAFRRGVLGPIANALAGVFGGGLFAGIFHNGGMVGAGAPMRLVPALAFADAPRLHAGGWAGLRPDEVPAILQRGERVLSRREVAAGMAGGGPQRLEITVQVEGARGNREIEEMVNAGVSGALQQYDRLVAPRTLARVSQDPRRRG